MATKRRHLKRTYRSGLEEEAAAFLKSRQKKVEYEKLKIEWEDLMYRKYTPDFLLPNYSHHSDRSPHLIRTRASSPPKIIKSSLKNFSGLEGTHLPSQDSVDYPGGLKSSRLDQDQHSSDQIPDTAVTPSIVSITQENRVKIQVPGLPNNKTSKTSLPD